MLERKQEGVDIWYLLYLFDYAKEVKGAVRLQKLVHICAKRGVPFNYSFTEFYYGPYSPELDRDIERFRELGIIDVKKVPSKRLTATGKRREMSVYSLTTNGKERLTKHLDKINDGAETIRNIVDDCNPLLLEHLIDVSLKEAGVDKVPVSVIEYFTRKPLKIYEELDSIELVHQLLAEKERK